MEIKFYEPSNDQLRKYIDRFYFLIRRREDKPVVYAAFPGTGYFVTVNENSKSLTQKEYKRFTYSVCELPLSELIFNFHKPHFIEYSGPTTELNICFKPLGINAFLENKLLNYTTGYSSLFYPFDDYRDYLAELGSILGLEKKVELTETYWLSKLVGFSHPFLSRAVEEMMYDYGNAPTISAIAARNKTSRSSLHKEFTEHLCTTPSQFRKVVRFRKAMGKNPVRSTIENLTDISNLANYFDQSHMIKDFKALTNQSPKSYFSRITPIAGGMLNWQFV